jgi:anti-sigma regulatory factor (Ser/Thr protein kinase)
VPLAFGREWLLLSDGITEAQNALREQFSEQAFPKFLEGRCLQHPSGSVADDTFLTDLENEWRTFRRYGPDPDDATALLVTDKRGRPAEGYACEIGAETIPELRSFCEQWISFIGFGEEEDYNLLLACDELFTNIYKHAYHGGSGPVRCTAVFDTEALTLIVTHQGDGFDPDAAQSGPRPHSKPGGYGLPFIRKVFDEVRFETEDGSSHVILRKSLNN